MIGGGLLSGVVGGRVGVCGLLSGMGAGGLLSGVVGGCSGGRGLPSGVVGGLPSGVGGECLGGRGLPLGMVGGGMSPDVGGRYLSAGSECANGPNPTRRWQ